MCRTQPNVRGAGSKHGAIARKARRRTGRPGTQDGNAPPDHDLARRRDRHRPVFKLRLHHPSGGPARRDHRVRHRFAARLLHHAEPRRAVCGHAVRRQLPPVCEAFHRPRHRVHHRRALLAELGGGARLRIHRRGPADATLVPAFARMGLVGRVHRGRVPAQHPVGAPVRRIGILVRVHQGVRHHHVHHHWPAGHVRRDSDRRL